MTTQPTPSADNSAQPPTLSEENLLPCPFCGKQPISEFNSVGVPGMEDCGYWGIDCTCGMAQVHADDEEFAIAKWNNRASAEIAARLQWRPISEAPKDGTLILLRVQSDRENWTPLEDAMEHTTIGSNSRDLNDIDEWTFAGWCWSHDHYTEGYGTPVMWMPLPTAPEMKGGQGA